MVCGNPAPVAMRAFPWRASSQFTFLTRRDTAGGASDGEYFLGIDRLHFRG
jgi:hypothetical protein